MEGPLTVDVFVGVSSLASTKAGDVQHDLIDFFIIHPNFRMTKDNMHFGYNDLALAKLKKGFEETPYVRPIPLGYLDWAKVNYQYLRLLKTVVFAIILLLSTAFVSLRLQI